MPGKFEAIRRDDRRLFKVSRRAWVIVGECDEFYLVKPRLLDNPRHVQANAARKYNSGAVLKSDWDRGPLLISLYREV